MQTSYFITAIVWVSISLLLLIVFVIMTYFTHRYFTKNQIVLKFEKDNKIVTKSFYKKIGSEIIVNNLKKPEEFRDYVPYLITVSSDLKGDLNCFTMPDEKVVITFSKKVKKPTEGFISQKYELKVPEAILSLEASETKEVLLLSIEDVKKHIIASNSKNSVFPIYNSFYYLNKNEENLLVLKCGEVIYGVVYDNQMVLKLFLRLPSFYVKDKLNNLENLTNIFDDLYSVIIDYHFKSVNQVFSLIDDSYSYVNNSFYCLEKNDYVIKNQNYVKYNSEILSIDYYLASVLDPLFDLALDDAQKYLEHLNKIRLRKLELESTFISEKTKMLDKLEKQKNEIKNDKLLLDKYKPSLKVKTYRTKEEIYKELDDIEFLPPSKLVLENIYDFIFSHKEMFSLNVQENGNSTRQMDVFYFINRPFLTIYVKNGYINFNIKLSKDYVNNVLIKKHSYFALIKYEKESDWYKLILDSSFDSYEEIYSLVFSSYNYIKDIVYDMRV